MKDEKSKSAIADPDRQAKSKETNVNKQMDRKKTRKRNKKVGLNMMLGKRSILKMTNIFHLDINKCSNEFQLDAIQRAISVKQELNKEEMKRSPTFYCPNVLFNNP